MAKKKAQDLGDTSARGGGDTTAEHVDAFDLLKSQMPPAGPAINPDVVIREIEPFCISRDITIKHASSGSTAIARVLS